MQCPLDDEVALVAKKDGKGAGAETEAVAHAHVVAGTYPLGVASCNAAQDYEFGLLAEGQNMLSSDEEDEHAPEPLDDDDDGSDGDDEGEEGEGGEAAVLRPRRTHAVAPRVLRFVPWEGAPGSAPPSPGHALLSSATAAGTPSGSDASSARSVSGSDDDDDEEEEEVVTVDPGAGAEEGDALSALSTPGSSRQARKARERARREEEKEREKREKRERKEEKEREKREKREEKEREKRARSKGCAAAEFLASAPPSSESDDDRGGVGGDQDSARSGTMSRSSSLLLGTGTGGDMDAAALRDAELQRRSEQYAHVLRGASRVILYDAQRARSRRLAQIFPSEDGEGEEGENERVVAVGTRGALDVAAVMRVLFERRDDATRLAVAGGDRYLNDVLRPYLELSLNAPLSAEPVLLFVLPVGHATDVARQIAARDADYAALFFDAVWERVLGARAEGPPGAADAAAVRERVRHYLAAGTRTQSFDIGEVHLTMPDDTSRPLPFIRAVQVRPAGDADAVRDTTVDYYTRKKKGDHEQRHNDKLALRLLVAARLPCLVRSAFHCDRDALQPTPDSMTTLIVESKRPNRVVQVLTGKIGGGHKKPTAATAVTAEASPVQPPRRGDSDDALLSGGAGGAAALSSSESSSASEHTIVLVSRLLLRSDGALSTSASSAGSSPASTAASASGLGSARGPFSVLVDGVQFANVKMLSIKSTWRTTRSLRIHSFN